MLPACAANSCELEAECAPSSNCVGVRKEKGWGKALADAAAAAARYGA
jgi:hypothetical protein